MSNFEDSIDEVREEIESGGWFKVEEGDNKMRVLVEPVHTVSRYGKGVCYKDCGYRSDEALKKDDAKLTHKYLTWILNYKSNTVMLYSLPFVISKQLADYKRDETNGYDFENFPMPYDITIHAKGAGKKTVEYTLKPSRENTDVSAEVLEKLSKESTVEQVIQSMKDKKMKEDGVGPKAPEYPENQGEPFPDQE